MKNLVAEWTLVILATVVGSCLVSLMVLFMGGGVEGSEVKPLLQLQLASVPAAVVLAIYCFAGFVLGDGWRKGLRRLWIAMPQWLVFMFLLLNAVSVSGVIANLIVAGTTTNSVSLIEYAPLLGALACSSAYLLLDARRRAKRGEKPALAGRWP